MARESRTVRVGPSGYQAVCPVPAERIRFWEGLALTVRGRLDAARNREVADADHTHSMHRLLHHFRMGEATVVQRIDEALSALDRELAPLEAVVAAAEPEAVAVPGMSELSAMPESLRTEWADRVRSARIESARAREASARRAQAVEALPALRSIRAGLLVEGEGVRRRWAEAYEVRASRYTRARFARGGAAIPAVPVIPMFVRGADPTGERSR